MRRWLPWAALGLLYVLHNDLWLWDDPRRIAGLPVGLLYHLIYCVAAAGLMAVLVSRFWPALDQGGSGDGGDER